jgi:hypothetical protein
MSIIKIFDNLANSFSVIANNLQIGAAANGYNSLNLSHVGSKVSYLARNFLPNDSIEFESGIGTVIADGSTLFISRQSIISSSNNNNLVSFSTAGTKIVYIVPNELNNKNAFNGLVNVSNNFNFSDYKATYIVDLNNNSISGTLPPATSDNAGLVIDIKTQNTNNNSFYIIPSGSQTIDNENSLVVVSDDFKRLVSNGSGWTLLEQPLIVQTGSPTGDTYSLQYNDGNGGFGASSLYTNNNGDLLIGDNTTPYSILRSSGVTEFNTINSDSDFVVHGTYGKNLYFDADGKLGINMPTGYLPQVPLHILQNACAESIRVENRHPSNASVLTLYHRPSTIPTNGSIPSKLNLAGKNSASNQINYASIKGKILSANTGSTLGALMMDIDDAGSDLNIIDISKFYCKIGPNNNVADNQVVVGKNNTIVGSGNVLVGDSVNYTGNNAAVVGKDNHYISMSSNGINLYSNGNTTLNIVSGQVGVGKAPTSALDVDGEVLASGITSNNYKYNTSYTTGTLPQMSGQYLIPSNTNLNNLFIGNTSGLLIKSGDIQGSGLSSIYVDNSNNLNIENNLNLPNISNNYALSLQNSSLVAYSGLALNNSDIIVTNPLKINTSSSYTVDNQSAVLYADGYVVASGLVIDPASPAASGSVLVNAGGGKTSWKELNAYDLVFNGLDISWNKYSRRNATINSSIQITITDSIDTNEFISGDIIEIIHNSSLYYTTITSKTVIGSNIVLLVSNMPISSGSASIVSATRGGYMNMSVPSGITQNTLSIRPNKDTLFNSGKANINYGIYGAATNYALYINANYSDNTLDESQVVVNGSIPYNISGTRYATLTVNGYLYTEDLKVGGEVDIDCGVVVFSGIPE